MTILIRYEIDVQRGAIKGINATGSKNQYIDLLYQTGELSHFISNIFDTDNPNELVQIGTCSQYINDKNKAEHLVTKIILRDINHGILYLVSEIELSMYFSKFDKKSTQ